jgi:diguanylate cyclase (GGDEF)-like protein
VAYAAGVVELFILLAITDISVVVGLVVGILGVVTRRLRESKNLFLVVTFLLMGVFTLIDILVSYGIVPWFDSLVNLVLFQLVVGVAYLVFHRLTDANRRTQELVAANLRLQEEKRHFEHKAKHDQLSGLYNREYLILALREEMLGATMQERDLSIAIFDIDRFKGINDSLGHNVGDRVIVDTAQLLRQYTRETEVVGRYGGDEFLVVLPACGSERAKDIAERLRRGFEEHAWPREASITISVGVAEYRGGTLEGFVDRADKALYTAKSFGRNQVYVFRDEEAPSAHVSAPPAPA